MNSKIIRLIEQAGFCLWQNESWNPGDIVDWSARYDDELKALIGLILQECQQVCVRTGQLEMQPVEGQMYANAIREHFEINDE
jgi:hypothetical protein